MINARRGCYGIPKGLNATYDTLNLYNGKGNVSQVRTFNSSFQIGSNLLWSNDSTGDKVRVLAEGVYAIEFHDLAATGTIYVGIAINPTTFSTSPVSMTFAQGIRALQGCTTGSGDFGCAHVTLYLRAGDEIRFLIGGTGTLSNGSDQNMATVSRVA